MPHSRFALHAAAPPQFIKVCAVFLPLVHGLRAFIRPHLDNCLDNPLFFASLSVAHGLRAFDISLRLPV